MEVADIGGSSNHRKYVENIYMATGIYNEIASKGPSATGVSRGQTRGGEERLTTVAAALLGKAVKLFSNVDNHSFLVVFD